MPAQPGYLEEPQDIPTRWLSRPIAIANAHFGWIVLATFLLLLVYQFYHFGVNFRIWDYMPMSGYAALVIGVYLARHNRQRFQHALKRLLDRGTLQLPGTAGQFMETLDADRRAWSNRGGVIVAMLLLAAYLVAYWPVTDSPPQMLWGLLAVGVAYIAGRILGRMVAFGFLGTYIDQTTVRIDTQPGHLDGACGLKPLGDFYFYQAGLVGIAAVHLALWSALIPVWTLRDYSRWGTSYFALLGVVIVLEILTFLWPMFSIHREMQRQKDRHLREADQLGRAIRERRRELEIADDVQRREVLSDQLQAMTERYHAIENMPTWPVDFKTKRRFTLSNLALITPFLGLILENVGLPGG